MDGGSSPSHHREKRSKKTQDRAAVLSRLATPRHLTRMVVLVVPVLPTAVVTRGHRLPFRLLLWPLLGIC